MLFDQEVAVPVLRRTLRVPYAFSNGVLNLVKPQRFAADENRATTTAMRLAIEGDLLHRHPENREQRLLIVVSTFEEPVTATDLRGRVDNVLDEYHVRVVHDDQIDDFAVEVEQQAH